MSVHLTTTHAAVQKLPIEVQEDIVDLLPLKDLIHLEQTCHHFYHLITNSRTIWSRRLNHECAANKLFPPSFGHLTTGTALRGACIAGPRLHWTCLKTPRDGDTLLPHTMISLNVPKLKRGSHQGNVNMRDGEPFVHDTSRHPAGYATWRAVRDAALIPGGKFLLVVYAQELAIWDLSSPSNPRLCSQEELTGAGEAVLRYALDVWVEDNAVIVKVLLVDPSSPGSETLNTARFFKLTVVEDTPLDCQTGSGQEFAKSEPMFCLRDIGRVAWAGDYDPPDIEARGGGFFFKFAGKDASSPRVLLFWSPKEMTFATLVPPTSIDLSKPIQMIFTDKCWVLVSHDGVFGFSGTVIRPRALPTHPLSLADYGSQMAVDPTFCIPFPDTSSPSSPATGAVPQIQAIPSPEELRSGAYRPLTYQLLACDHRYESLEMHLVFQGTLFFNHHDPAKSHMTVDEVLGVHVADWQVPQAGYPNRRLCDGGRVEGMMWVVPRTPFTRERDNEAHYMSLSMNKWWAMADLDLEADKIGEVDGLAPFITRAYWREESPSVLLTTSFCPASASAVVVWGDGTEGNPTWFDLYRFY